MKGVTSRTIKGENNIARMLEILLSWRTDGANYAEPEQYRSVGLKELEEKEYSLVPSRYIQFVDRDSKINYEEVLTETASTVSGLLKRQEKNDKTLRNALKKLGYECD